MKRIVRFLNVAILALFASCTILWLGSMELMTVDFGSPADQQEIPYPIDGEVEELNPRSDFLFPYDNLFQESDRPETVHL